MSFFFCISSQLLGGCSPWFLVVCYGFLKLDFYVEAKAFELPVVEGVSILHLVERS
jgi:hypothetical protein